MHNFVETFGNRRVALSILTVGLGAAVLTGCGTEYTVSGTVQKGANGQEYVVPNNAHRPVYDNKAACEADLKAHAALIKQETGAEVDPSTACQPVAEYHPILYPRGYYYGVMTSGSGEWRSTDVVTWSPVRDGQFAAKGESLQHDVVTAPDDSTEGEHTSVQEHEGSIFDNPGDHSVVDDPHVSVGGDK